MSIMSGCVLDRDTALLNSRTMNKNDTSGVIAIVNFGVFTSYDTPLKSKKITINFFQKFCAKNIEIARSGAAIRLCIRPAGMEIPGAAKTYL